MRGLEVDVVALEVLRVQEGPVVLVELGGDDSAPVVPEVGRLDHEGAHDTVLADAVLGKALLELLGEVEVDGARRREIPCAA